MPKALVTGSCGLVGYAACNRLLREGWEVTGLDNDARAEFFGPEASTKSLATDLLNSGAYWHVKQDIVHYKGVVESYLKAKPDLIIHAAAQPSHDWAAHNIHRDFSINAIGTLNMLLAWKEHAPQATFIHISTSKVYGDNPNTLVQYRQYETRYEPVLGYENGFDEYFPVDRCLHSFFGVSKLSGDLLAQEFGRNFGMSVGIFRPGCVTGKQHKAAELHGFLAYLVKCIKEGKTYKIYGYQGKQVRCNVHAEDLVDAFLLFAKNPKPGEVYNIGGRDLDCSILEAIKEIEKRLGRTAKLEYVDVPRRGDHIWWVSNTRKLQQHYGWKPSRSLASIFDELCGV